MKARREFDLCDMYISATGTIHGEDIGFDRRMQLWLDINIRQVESIAQECGHSVDRAPMLSAQKQS